MRIKPFICAFFCTSLIAGHIDDAQLAILQGRYLSHTNFFAGYSDNARTFLVGFVRQDSTPCGMCWDICKIPPEEQSIWECVGKIILVKMFAGEGTNDFRLNQMTQKLRLYFEKNESVSPCYGWVMPQIKDVVEVMGCPSFKQWDLAMTAGALIGKPPGTLMITAIGAECCLLRETTNICPEYTLAAQQSSIEDRIDSLQKTFVDVSSNLQRSLSSLSKHLYGLQSTFDILVRRVSALEDAERATKKKK